MNSVVEKLASIEQEIAVLQPKMAPLVERMVALDQRITGFAQQLTDLAVESAAVKQDIELTRQGLTRIQTLIGESKTESEHIAAGQEENLQRYKAMESFVGTLYQLHSQSVQIAQWLGLADQAKMVFPAPPSVPAGVGGMQTAGSSGMVEPPKDAILASIDERVQSEPIMDEPPAEELPAEEPPAEEPLVEEPPEEEPLAEELSVPEPPETESTLLESDFDAVIPDADKNEPEPLSMPGLPNVAALPEMETADSDTEPSDEMASQLDVAPLNLAVPLPPESNEPPPEMNENDEQEIEAMLAAMGTPVTIGS